VMVLSSHADDGAHEAMQPRCNVDADLCWRQHCRVILTTVLPRRFGHGMRYMPSHPGESVVELCWRQCYRVILVTMLPMRHCCGAMSMLSHVDDGAAEVT
jgi:hypothetical protein